MDPRPAFHHLAEDDEDEQVSGGLNHLVPRNAGGAQWTWKKFTVVVDSGGGDRDAEEHLPELRSRRKSLQLQIFCFGNEKNRDHCIFADLMFSNQYESGDGDKSLAV